MTKAMIIVFFKVIWHSLSRHKRFIVPMKFIEDIRVSPQYRFIIVCCGKCNRKISISYKMEGEVTQYDIFKMILWGIPYYLPIHRCIVEKINEE